MNVYELANKELERLWQLFLHLYQESRKEDGSVSRRRTAAQDLQSIIKEIHEFRTLIKDRLKDHDPKLHEKIAEMALLGSIEENKMNLSKEQVEKKLKDQLDDALEGVNGEGQFKVISTDLTKMKFTVEFDIHVIEDDVCIVAY